MKGVNEERSLLFFVPDAQPVINLALPNTLLGEPPLKRREITFMLRILHECHLLRQSPSQNRPHEQPALTAGTDPGASSAASGRASGCRSSCPSPYEPELYSSAPPPAFSCCCGSPPPSTAAHLNCSGS